MHNKITDILQVVNSTYARHGHGLLISFVVEKDIVLIALRGDKESSFVIDLNYANDDDLKKLANGKMNQALRECGKTFCTLGEFRA